MIAKFIGQTSPLELTKGKCYEVLSVEHTSSMTPERITYIRRSGLKSSRKTRSIPKEIWLG